MVQDIKLENPLIPGFQQALPVDLSVFPPVAIGLKTVKMIKAARSTEKAHRAVDFCTGCFEQ